MGGGSGVKIRLCLPYYWIPTIPSHTNRLLYYPHKSFLESLQRNRPLTISQTKCNDNDDVDDENDENYDDGDNDENDYGDDENHDEDDDDSDNDASLHET